MHKFPRSQSSNNYSEKQKKKKKKKFIIIIIIIFNENNLRDFWANIKCTNIPIIQVPKG